MDPNQQPEPEPMLPPAEQMRQRRLAKLTANNSNNNNATASSDSRNSSVGPTPVPSTTSPTPTPETTNTSAPSLANTTQPTQTSSRKITITPAAPKQPSAANPSPSSQTSAKNKLETRDGTPGELGNNHNTKRSSSAIDIQSTANPPSKKLQTSKDEPTEDWSNRILGDLFRVTLDESRLFSSRGEKLTYLSGLRAELEQSGEPLKLTAETIDSAINEAARSLPRSQPLLGYLLPCWNRVTRAAQPARPLPQPRLAVLIEAKRLCMSNCIFALTMPELFERNPQPAHDSLVPYLLRGPDHENGVSLDFFSEAISRMQEDEETVAPIFTDAIARISGELADMTMNDEYKPYVHVLLTYSKFKPLMQVLVKHPNFLFKPGPGMTKEQIAVASETRTLLGPFFRISPLQSEVSKSYFPSPRTIDDGHVKQAQESMRLSLQTHQADLFNITDALVRAGVEARANILDWFAYTLNTNHKRRALQVKAKDVASDGFMVNVTAILDRLCQPFMDTTFDKVGRIDINYLQRKPRIDMSDETKLNADQATSDAFYDRQAGGSNNFITEVFFLTLAAHHYGLGATHSKLKDLDKDIKYIEGVIRQMEGELVKLQNDPMRLAVAKQHRQNAISAVEKHIADKHAIRGVVSDQNTQELSLTFMRYVAVWLLRVASGSEYVPGKAFHIPLPADKSDAFSCLPEYALQDVVDNFKFIFRHLPQILLSAIGDEIPVLCITFLRSSEYIKNPYLKSSLVTLLFDGTWPVYHKTTGILGDNLIGSDFAQNHLLRSLMKFYIECEHSGVSSAFYDKFNIRYEIFQVIKCIWANNVYHEQLSRESRLNRPFFVQFVNLLLNDATFLLDEGLTKLFKIHDYQEQLQNSALTPEEREKTTTDLEAAEQQCTSWMQLVNDTTGMMKLFTEALRDAFTMPEIVTRLAGMLNYNLEILVGPKRSQLKVSDSHKYHFQPRALLSDLIDIYLNLGSKTAFVDALAADGRSYKPENYAKAAGILQNNLAKPPETIQGWATLSNKVAEAKSRLDQAELDLGDIPEEFEDPLMGDLMTDPVVLPSQNIVDRSTIIQQLLSNPRDPFTRSPMTIDDVVPADDLRARIQAWKAERIAAAQAKLAGDQMDTSTG